MTILCLEKKTWDNPLFNSKVAKKANNTNGVHQKKIFDEEDNHINCSFEGGKKSERTQLLNENSWRQNVESRPVEQ